MSPSTQFSFGPALCAIAAFAAAALSTSQADAQAWIHPAGEGYVEVGARHLSGQAFYNSSGESLPIASRYSQNTLTTYGEIGVIDRWLQLNVGGELYRRSALADQGATRGIGDLSLGAFTGLIQGTANLSVGVTLGVPTGDADPTSGLGDPQADIIAASLPTGSGAYSLTPTLAFGVGFGGGWWPLNHYFTASAGYLAWFGFADSATYSAEFGTSVRAPFADRFTLRLALRGLEPLTDVAIASFSGVGEGVTHTSWRLGLAVRIWKGVGAHAGVESAFRAKNIISAMPVSAGLHWSF